MNFEYDIFISYDSPEGVNNEAGKQWASRFCEYLAIIMNRLNNRELTFLLHDDLRARKELMGNNVRSIFSKTAIFVTIVSPDTTLSKSYMAELEEIYNSIYRDTDEITRKTNRIFKVITLPLVENQPVNFQFLWQ